MIKKRCSFCDGKGYIGEVPDALEAFISTAINPDYEQPVVDTCPICNGSGVQYEIELKDLCEVKI